MCSGLVVVGVVWRCSTPLYLALGVCVVCGGGVSLYRVACGSCFIYKAGRKSFLIRKHPYLKGKIIITKGILCVNFISSLLFTIKHEPELSYIKHNPKLQEMPFLS